MPKLKGTFVLLPPALHESSLGLVRQCGLIPVAEAPALGCVLFAMRRQRVASDGGPAALERQVESVRR